MASRDGDARWGPHAFVVVFNDAVENVGLAFGESAVDAEVNDVVKEDRDGFQGTGVVGNVKDVLNAVKVAAVAAHALVDEDGPGLEFGRGESVIAGGSERHQTALERLDQLDNVRVVRERGLPRHARLAMLVRHIGRHIQAEQMLAYLQRRRHLRFPFPPFVRHRSEFTGLKHAKAFPIISLRSFELATETTQIRVVLATEKCDR
eukprot:scaffold29330_cov56-Attheya_sp.AAC.3